jgi:hypothetical protein
VCLGKRLPDSFPIQNGLKQGDALSPLLFNFALGSAIRKCQENQVVLKLNGTHQTEWDGVDLIDMAQDMDQFKALVKTVMNLRVP